MSATSPEGTKCRVALIEDDTDSREMLADLLEVMGHEVVFSAGLGVTGATHLQSAADVDVALVDLTLPDIDGYEVARRVRASQQKTRLVALTGHSEPEARAAATVAGFDAYLVKPLDFDALAAVFA